MRQSGFSLIEVLIVVALIAFVYGVALPQLNLRSGAEIASKVNQLAGDVRSAYDMAVLSGKTHRIVFMLATGEYWLEVADQEDVYLGDDKLNRDLTNQEEKDLQQDLDAKFQEFIELAGRTIVDPDNDKEVAPESPVLAARERLRRPTWARVDNMEWAERKLGPNLGIKMMQAEHHGQRQDLSEQGVEARTMLYFFPGGYVERAMIQIGYKKDDYVIDETQEGYTLVTEPYEGTARIQDGWTEIDVHEKKHD